MTATPKHGQLSQSEQGIHVAHQFYFPNATSRTSAPASRLTGGASKLALQGNDFSLWLLSSVSPTPTWVAVGAGSAGNDATGQNLGTGIPLFQEAVGGDLRFRTIVAGTGVNVASATSTITITTSAGGAGTYLPLSGSVMSGSIGMRDNVISRAEIRDWSETFVDAASSGSTYTIDLEQGNTHKVTLNTNSTFSFVNPPATGKVGSFTLIAVQGTGGSKEITWPASVDWASATPPTLTDAAGASDIFTFFTYTGGTQWFGFLAGGNMG